MKVFTLCLRGTAVMLALAAFLASPALPSHAARPWTVLALDAHGGQMVRGTASTVVTSTPPCRITKTGAKVCWIVFGVTFPDTPDSHVVKQALPTGTHIRYLLLTRMGALGCLRYTAQFVTTGAWTTVKVPAPPSIHTGKSGPPPPTTLLKVRFTALGARINGPPLPGHTTC